MKTNFATAKKPHVIILHGGAGPEDPKGRKAKDAKGSLRKIAELGMGRLKRGERIVNVAQFCVAAMEKDPQFNAGIGSALQRDGTARLSASMMDGTKQRFSGVMSMSYLAHPSVLAKELQKRNSRVLTLPGAEILARQLGLPLSLNHTSKAIEKWVDRLNHESKGKLNSNFDCDTVGCVVKNHRGQLIAASSTGGRGFEFPGRVSDTATVAGNYASRFLAVAATGIGEQIMDAAVAARLETRVRDGMDLFVASEKLMKEAHKWKHQYGWIAVDQKGNWVASHTTPHMAFTVVEG